MKSISNWSLLGYLAGATYFLVTVFQYWIRYPDTSQFLMNSAIAVLIASVAWLYNRQMQHGFTIDAMEEYLADNPNKLQEVKQND